MANEVTIRVPPEFDGERVDKALAVLLGISRAQARLLVEEGTTVDGSPVRPGDRVVTGGLIVTSAPPEKEALEPEPVDFSIVYEDDAVIVVDKPAGLVVHPGSGQRRGTLAAGLLYRYPDLAGVGQADRWGLVHRLDKETSGVLIVARTNESYDYLTEALRRREIKRTYLTLVDGTFTSPTGTIDAPIGRDPTRPTRRAVTPGGKPATTHYEVERVFEELSVSLLRVSLETGRTHQIRVHLAAIGHQVVGDKTYGSKTTKVRAPRVFLHASSVGFRHPNTGLEVVAEASLPGDLVEVLADLAPG